MKTLVYSFCGPAKELLTDISTKQAIEDTQFDGLPFKAFKSQIRGDFSNYPPNMNSHFDRLKF